MIRFVRRRRGSKAWAVSVAFVACLFWQSAEADTAGRLPAPEIDKAAVAAIPAWQGKPAQVLQRLDLSEPFSTISQWTFAAMQDPHPADNPSFEDHGLLAACFAKARSVECAETYSLTYSGESGIESLKTGMYSLYDAEVVYTGSGKTDPLLWLQTCSEPAMNGDCNVRTVIYGYDRKADRFHPVFVNDTRGKNNNQEARFIHDGPLRGNVIVNTPTDNAPFIYWIEVYARQGSGDYSRILRYRGKTVYGDSNPLAVIDSEMPEILKRLGKWKPGDALPVPESAPKGCTRLVMRNGEEWCRSAADGG